VIRESSFVTIGLWGEVCGKNELKYLISNNYSKIDINHAATLSARNKKCTVIVFT
jgi:hypothetical protein